MFATYQFVDSVDVKPSHFGDPWPAIAQTLKKRYLNKVVPDLGLAVAFGGFISCEDSVIRTRAASGSVRVRFSLVLFAPKQGHVLKGWVAEVSPTRGVKISMMFFDNIWVPLEHCPPDIVFENRPNTNELGLHTPDSLCPNTEPGVKQWWIYMFDYVLSVVKYVDYKPKDGSAMQVVCEMRKSYTGPLKWRNQLLAVQVQGKVTDAGDYESSGGEEEFPADDQELVQ